MKDKAVKIISKVIPYIFLVIVLIITVFPLVYTISASFKTNTEIMTSNDTLLPKMFTFENYKIAWSNPDFNVPKLVTNSAYFALITMLFRLITTAMAGYVFARGHFLGQKVVFGILTGLMFVNLGSATTVPLLKIVKGLHLNGSLNGLVLIRAFSINVTGIYLVRGFIQELPKELDEAAQIDGCGFFRTFANIILPLLKPVLATIGLLAFQGSWNETLMPLIFTISSPSQRTLSAALYVLKNVGESASQWNLMMAGSVISILPVLVVYAVGNKYFVSGLASGAVKG